ncbi:MAG: hypothetical protein RL748_1801, partial [Pseudomonadota bacterium]
FVLVLHRADNPQAVQSVAQKILQSLGQHYEIGSKQINTTPSIGIALFPQDAVDADTLMKNADLAMYRAKAQGRNGVHFFEPD